MGIDGRDIPVLPIRGVVCLLFHPLPYVLRKHVNRFKCAIPNKRTNNISEGHVLENADFLANAEVVGVFLIIFYHDLHEP